MAAPDYDVVVLGGGLAGLSLAVRLCGLDGCRVLVIEPRAAYRRDRTWSYWRLLDHPFGDAVAHRWDSWETSERAQDGTCRTIAARSARYPYETIPADRLYATARERIARSPNVTLRLGCRALGVEEGFDRVRVETSDGEVGAALVFDSRPPPPCDGDLVQRFLGQEVVVDRPVFDPGRLTLMDFAVAQLPGAVRFLYVLPTSPHAALVEDTWLAPAAMPLPDHRAALRTYLADRFGAAVTSVTFEEEGAIPMSPGLQAPASAGRVIPIGTPGGAVKPSSGYAFLGIQRTADAIAADLAAGRRPAPFQPRGAAWKWMDAVLLSALQRSPEIAPHLFTSLFARCQSDALIRFLNDVGTPADALRVIAAMPKRPMIAAALRPLAR